MTRDEMDTATAHLPTKSSKIRTLAKLGATRVEIASYLQIRYQHVRNVLVGPAPLATRGHTAAQQPEDGAREAKKAGQPISIEEAKRGLAAQFGVLPGAIEITIRG